MTRASEHVDWVAGTVDVLVIGAGHAGLAMSHVLDERGVDHVVLERGEIANSWRHERRESLRLLTPNWQTRLPGRAYDGAEPDGFMTVPELVRFLEDYAADTYLPVITRTTVKSVRRDGCGYRVDTNRGTWKAKAVVFATGACNLPWVPAIASDLPGNIRQLTPLDYRSPESVLAGGVLVVGASASGLQIADELLETGVEVTLAVGEHVRMPRTYRGRDIFYWLERAGIHDQHHDEVEDLARGRRLPSPQLIGSSEPPIFDLNHLAAQGARIAGRLVGVRGTELLFSGSLHNVCALADLKMRRLLKQIDETADAEHAPPAESFAPTLMTHEPPLNLDAEQQNIRTVIWATGFRPDYRWLDVPVLDRKGHLRHEGGVVASPGLYVLGLPLMRRRKSSFIFGIEDDVRDIAAHLDEYLVSTSRRGNDDIDQNPASKRGVRRSA